MCVESLTAVFANSLAATPCRNSDTPRGSAFLCFAHQVPSSATPGGLGGGGEGRGGGGGGEGRGGGGGGLGGEGARLPAVKQDG